MSWRFLVDKGKDWVYNNRRMETSGYFSISSFGRASAYQAGSGGFDPRIRPKNVTADLLLTGRD